LATNDRGATGSAIGGSTPRIMAATDGNSGVWTGNDRHDCRQYDGLAVGLGWMVDKKALGKWTKLN